MTAEERFQRWLRKEHPRLDTNLDRIAVARLYEAFMAGWNARQSVNDAKQLRRRHVTTPHL